MNHASEETSPTSAAEGATVESHLKLDDEQFSRLLSHLQPSPTPRWTVEKLATLLQVVALVTGAVWALFLYYSFQRESDKLELQRRQHEVNLQQADAQQQRLAIEMAKLSLVAEQSRSQLAAIEAHGAAEERFLVKAFALRVKRERAHPDGTHSYAAHLIVTLEGASEKEFEISYSITQAFIGTLTSGSLPAMSAVELNPPPDIFNRIPGPIDWRRVSQANHVYGPTTYDLRRVLRIAHVLSPPSNAGLVASLRKGQIAHYETTFLVRAKPANYLGVSVSLGLNGTTTPARNYWYLRSYQALSSLALATQ